MDYPFYGSGRCGSPPRGCHPAGTGWRLMAVMATWRPRTSVANSEHRSCGPRYLPGGVWCADITYISQGFDGLGHPARALLAAVQWTPRSAGALDDALVRASPDPGPGLPGRPSPAGCGRGVLDGREAGSSTTSSSNGLAVAGTRHLHELATASRPDPARGSTSTTRCARTRRWADHAGRDLPQRRGSVKDGLPALADTLARQWGAVRPRASCADGRQPARFPSASVILVGGTAHRESHSRRTVPRAPRTSRSTLALPSAVQRSRTTSRGAVAELRRPNQISPERVHLPMADGSYIVQVGLIPGDFLPPPDVPYRVPVEFVRIDSAYVAYSLGRWEDDEHLYTYQYSPGVPPGLPFPFGVQLAAGDSPLVVYVSSSDRYEVHECARPAGCARAPDLGGQPTVRTGFRQRQPAASSAHDVPLPLGGSEGAQPPARPLPGSAKRGPKGYAWLLTSVRARAFDDERLFEIRGSCQHWTPPQRRSVLVDWTTVVAADAPSSASRKRRVFGSAW